MCVFKLFDMQCNVFKDISALRPASCRNKMFAATSGVLENLNLFFHI